MGVAAWAAIAHGGMVDIEADGVADGVSDDAADGVVDGEAVGESVLDQRSI